MKVITILAAVLISVQINAKGLESKYTSCLENVSSLQEKVIELEGRNENFMVMQAAGTTRDYVEEKVENKCQDIGGRIIGPRKCTTIERSRNNGYVCSVGCMVGI